MALIVSFDSEAVPVKNQVKQWFEDEPFKYEGQKDFLTLYDNEKDPTSLKRYQISIELLKTIALHYLKVEPDVVVEMDDKEKSNIDAQEAADAAAKRAALIAAFDDLFFNAKIIDFNLSKSDSIIDGAQNVDDLKFLLKQMMRFLFTLWTGLKGKLPLPPN